MLKVAVQAAESWYVVFFSPGCTYSCRDFLYHRTVNQFLFKSSSHLYSLATHPKPPWSVTFTQNRFPQKSKFCFFHQKSGFQLIISEKNPCHKCAVTLAVCCISLLNDLNQNNALLLFGFQFKNTPKRLKTSAGPEGNRFWPELGQQASRTD